MTTPSRKKSVARILYLLSVLFLTLTGFGQMPIFKRYYIADIPGLGWLAKFYVTHYMHYLFAVLLLAVAAYAAADYCFDKRKAVKITTSGYARVFILSGLLITGILLVIRNFPGPVLSPGLIIFLDVTHLGLVMALLGTGLVCVFTKKGWTQAAN